MLIEKSVGLFGLIGDDLITMIKEKHKDEDLFILTPNYFFD